MKDEGRIGYQTKSAGARYIAFMSRKQLFYRAIPVAFLFAFGLAVQVSGRADDERADQALRAEIAIARTARVSLAEAIRRAEVRSGGRAIEAGLDRETDAFWTVEIIRGNDLERLAVDVQKGLISAAPTSAGKRPGTVGSSGRS